MPTQYITSLYMGTSGDTVWSSWIDSTASATTDTAWHGWNTGSASPHVWGNALDVSAIWTTWTTDSSNLVYPLPPQETPEERDARRAREAEHLAQVQQEREEAQRRAHELLEENLSATQLRMRREHGRFQVRGSRGGVYEICPGIAGNVYRLDAQGRRSQKLCIHPSGFPEADVHLTQKLMLETDEDAFVATANVSRA